MEWCNKMADEERDWGKIALAGLVIFLVGWITTSGFTNVPIVNWPIIPTIPQPGVQTKSTVVFYNGTAVNDGTLQLITFAGVPVASGAISAGTGTTGTVIPGVYLRYISGVTGAAIFIDTVNVTKISDVAQTYVTLPAVQLYRNSSEYAFMMAAEGSAYTRDYNDGPQTNKNFTLSAQVAATFTLTMTEKLGYAQLFESLQDPITKVSCEPILWIEVTSTNAYTTSSAVKNWDDTTKTYFLLPLSVVFNPTKESKVATSTLNLVLPTAQTAAYAIYIVSYSDMTTLLNAKTRVANAAGPFTVEVFTLCSGWMVSS